MLVPLYNKVIVEILAEKEDTATKSGIILVNKQNPFYRGKVLSVGKGHYQNAQRIEMDVKVGDTIMFLKNSGMGVEIGDNGIPTKIILADNDIFAVVTE